MNKTEQQVFKQDGATIHVLHPSSVCQAIIYSDEQRQKINELISEGYLPDHTSVGCGKATRANFSVESYKGKFGEGFKMVTTSPYSSNFNHLTYFIKKAA